MLKKKIVVTRIKNPLYNQGQSSLDDSTVSSIINQLSAVQMEEEDEDMEEMNEELFISTTNGSKLAALRIFLENLSEQLLAETKKPMPEAKLIYDLLQKAGEHLQQVLSMPDKVTGNTPLHNLVIGLINYSLSPINFETKNPSVIKMLYSLNLIASAMDDTQQRNATNKTVHEILDQFSKLKKSPTDVLMHEKLIICIRTILHVNMRMRQLHTECLDFTNQQQFNAPVILLECHVEDAPFQFFTKDIKNFVATHNINILALEVHCYREYSSNDNLDAKMQAIGQLGLSHAFVEELPQYPGSEKLVSDAYHEFSILELVNKSRDRCMFYNTIIAMHKYNIDNPGKQAKACISAGIAHGPGIINLFKEISTEPPKCYILSTPGTLQDKDVIEERQRFVDKLTSEYGAEIIEYSPKNSNSNRKKNKLRG